VDSISTTHRFAAITEQGQIITSISNYLPYQRPVPITPKSKRSAPPMPSNLAIVRHHQEKYTVRCVKRSQPLQPIATDLCNNNHNMQPDRFTHGPERRSRHRAFSCSNQLHWWLPCWIQRCLHTISVVHTISAITQNLGETIRSGATQQGTRVTIATNCS
jgi:hypothetical protein